MRRSIPHVDAGAPDVWIDLISPTEAEIEQVQHELGITVPNLAALREIETTSRLRADGEKLYMSAPIIAASHPDKWEIAPTGFILLPSTLITVRYTEIALFDAVAAELDDAQDVVPGLVFARLLEETVDRAADHLEHAADTVNAVSQRIFSEDANRSGLNRETQALRKTILKIGRASDRSARVRYMFLSVGRMVTFVMDRCIPKLAPDLIDRLQAIRHDISSLDEFEASLSGRIQLLQDAATGLISIEQNDVVKVLTVASVVGVPPVLVVGIYGMNFKYMPELGWHLGYPYALLLCLLSAAVPYVWFKWRGWI
jgi:magnesium transporter